MAERDEALHSAVARDVSRNRSRDIASLVWADMNRANQRAERPADDQGQPAPDAPASPPTRPALPSPKPVIDPIFDSTKGVTDHE